MLLCVGNESFQFKQEKGYGKKKTAVKKLVMFLVLTAVLPQTFSK